MIKKQFHRLFIWALGTSVLALALISTNLLLAQGTPPAKAPAKAAPKAPAKAAPKAPPSPAAKEAPLQDSPAKPVEIPERDRKLELARAGEVVITVGDLADRINQMSRYVRGRYESVEKKRNLLESMVEFEVLAKEASRRGFDKHPDVVQMLRQVMIQRLRQKVVEDQIRPESIGDAEVKEYYEKHKDQYNKPETVRISHILLKDEATAKNVLKEVQAKGEDPRAFRGIVQQHSIDEATKQRAGDLRYFTRDETRVPKPVVEAAFKLVKRGDVAGPIKSEAGFHVIKLTHRREAISRPADDEKVKNQIVTRILREKRTTALESFKKNLRDKASVKIHEDRVAAVKIDTTIQQRGAAGLPQGPRGRMGKMPGAPGVQRGPRGQGMPMGVPARPGRPGPGSGAPSTTPPPGAP